jgi:hypothetical protein
MVRTVGLVALALMLTLSQAAGAGNFHFNSYSFTLGSLELTGELVGLGNEGAAVTLVGRGTVTGLCQNKAGNQAPGRNPIAIAVQQTNTFTADQNGHALVHVILEDPTLPEIAPSPKPKQAGCPNGNWSITGIVDGSTNWTAADVIVADDAGNVRLTLHFACTTFFQNGVGVGIQCVEV